MTLIGFISQVGASFWLGLAVAAALLLYQQRLIHLRQRDACFKAFLNNHYVGLTVFIGLLFSYPVFS
jgi:4-hydroxybenzoate polyprenyltransferase